MTTEIENWLMALGIVIGAVGVVLSGFIVLIYSPEWVGVVLGAFMSCLAVVKIKRALDKF